MKHYEWAYRQKHEEDLDKTLRETGKMFGEFIQRFNGLLFWKMFNHLGHTSSNFNDCDCWNKIKKFGVEKEVKSGLVIYFVETT